MKIYTDSSTKFACYVIEGSPPNIHAYKRPVTNNIGEYKALIRALQKANELNLPDALFLTDSKLVADQLNGTAKVKAEHLKSYHALAKELLGLIGAKIAWISRKENLAGLVLDC